VQMKSAVKHTASKTGRFIQRANSFPVYRQVAELLERDMQRSRSKNERTALPSENELATEFKVSRVTVRQALDELHRKGLIYREKGRGSYARSQHIGGVTGFGSFTSEVENAGSKPSSRFVGFVKISSLPAGMKRHLTKVPAKHGGYYCLTRVRCVDARPVAFEETYLDVETYPGIDKADVESGSLYATMRRLWGYEPAWADAAIEPGVADEAIAGHLGIKIGEPVVVAWRVTSSEHDEILEYVRSIYRGDGFALTVRRHKIS
jgi:GntR family transcriptional regulator